MSEREENTGIPGNEIADSTFGRFMAWAGEQPVAAQLLTPGVIVAIGATLFGVPVLESLAAGGLGSAGTYAVAIWAQS